MRRVQTSILILLLIPRVAAASQITAQKGCFVRFDSTNAQEPAEMANTETEVPANRLAAPLPESSRYAIVDGQGREVAHARQRGHTDGDSRSIAEVDQGECPSYLGFDIRKSGNAEERGRWVSSLHLLPSVSVSYLVPQGLGTVPGAEPPSIFLAGAGFSAKMRFSPSRFGPPLQGLELGLSFLAAGRPTPTHVEGRTGFSRFRYTMSSSIVDWGGEANAILTPWFLAGFSFHDTSISSRVSRNRNVSTHIMRNISLQRLSPRAGLHFALSQLWRMEADAHWTRAARARTPQLGGNDALSRSGLLAQEEIRDVSVFGGSTSFTYAPRESGALSFFLAGTAYLGDVELQKGAQPVRTSLIRGGVEARLGW